MSPQFAAFHSYDHPDFRGFLQSRVASNHVVAAILVKLPFHRPKIITTNGCLSVFFLTEDVRLRVSTYASCVFFSGGPKCFNKLLSVALRVCDDHRAEAFHPSETSL
jgi:hypothetical protein